MFDFKLNSQGQMEATFTAKLTNVGTTELQNSNGKNYKIVTLEFPDAQGTIVTHTAQCYEGNYSKGIEVGKEYLTTVRIVDDKAYLQMSHLQKSAIATPDTFGFVAATTVAKVATEAYAEA